MKLSLQIEIEVHTLPQGNKQAAINYLLPAGMSLPSTFGLPGATDDQAIFNLFRGQTPRDDLGHAFAFLFKAIPALTPPAEPKEKPGKKEKPVKKEEES